MKNTISVRCGEGGHGQLVGEIWWGGGGWEVNRRDGRQYWYSGRGGEPTQDWGWTLPDLPADFWHTEAPYWFACPRHKELRLPADEARDAVNKQKGEVLAHSVSL